MTAKKKKSTELLHMVENTDAKVLEAGVALIRDDNTRVLSGCSNHCAWEAQQGPGVDYGGSWSEEGLGC